MVIIIPPNKKGLSRGQWEFLSELHGLCWSPDFDEETFKIYEHNVHRLDNEGYNVLQFYHSIEVYNDILKLRRK